MSKKKGVSAEEKRTRMLELLYEKKDFFQMKELEKIAPKEKGIIAQSVKDVVQSLVDDGLVDTDKIGTSVYFWAYPSKAQVSREKRLADLRDKFSEVNQRLEDAKSKLEASKAGKENSEERVAILEKLKQLTARKEELTREVQKYSDNDPEVIQQIREETTKAVEAANRWTDNLFAIKSWCKNKFSVEESALDKQFGIPVDMDYLE